MSEVELVNLQRAGVWLVEWNGDSFKAEDVTPPQAEQKEVYRMNGKTCERVDKEVEE